MSPDEIEKRFSHHPPRTEAKVAAHEQARALVKATACMLDELLPDSREKALMMTALEETLMWANAGIARN